MKKLLAGLLAAFSMLVATASPINYATRPASATGTGYFVAGSKIFDPSGKEFRIRGSNINHFDINHQGIELMGFNTIRTALYLTRTTDYNWGTVQNDILNRGMVPMVESQDTTCKGDFATLDKTINTWLSQASTWQKLNPVGFFDPANEWGVAATWRDGWAAEIPKIRAAGITAPLVIDAPNCGQDAGTLVKDGKYLEDLDPEHNILFDVHVYGSFHYPATAAWMQDYSKAMASLKASGLPLILGEFGPPPVTDANGIVHTIGPSPTYVPTDKLIFDAEANEFGWMPWSWDNNNLLNCAATDYSFSMLYNVCKPYTGDDTQLTNYGKAIKRIVSQYRPSPSNDPVLSVVNGAVGFKLPSTQPATYSLTYTNADLGKAVPVTIIVGN